MRLSNRQIEVEVEEPEKRGKTKERPTRDDANYIGQKKALIVMEEVYTIAVEELVLTAKEDPSSERCLRAVLIISKLDRLMATTKETIEAEERPSGEHGLPKLRLMV